MLKNKPKPCKDPFENKRYGSIEKCEMAMLKYHKAQLDELGLPVSQVLFNYRNKYPLNKRYGSCMISGKPTEWDNESRRYKRFHSPKEAEIYKKRFRERMMKKYGKEHLLDDMEQQRKMLANRSISGEYEFTNQTAKEYDLKFRRKQYVGSYERDFLIIMDVELNWDPIDIIMPAPQTVPYIGDDGEEHFYIPDAYIPSLNAIIEIKATDNKHYRARDIAIEKIKDKIMKKNKKIYFIKIEDKNYEDLLEYIDIMIYDY